MGLLIKLQNGDTSLKSLKFGNDRPGGGDSGQPYIKDPILDNPLPESKDFLLRGGLNAPIDSAQDVVRLTKYMFDLKSPSGLLFTAKQNLLSRTAPKTEASKGIGYAGGALNEGVYTPLSTLAQAGVGFAGIHLNKQGIDPTGLIPSLSIKKYEQVVNTQDENRLITLANLTAKGRSQNNFNFINGYNLNVGNDVITYGGGPGSVLGIGKTNIKYATNKSGNIPLQTSIKEIGLWTRENFSTIPQQHKGTGIILDDFREKTQDPNTTNTFLSVSPGYKRDNNIEFLYNLGNPGQKGDISNFTKGKTYDGNYKKPLDTVNAYPIYKSTTTKYGTAGNETLNDLIPFSIAILNNDIQKDETTGNYNAWKKFIHFRAFIDSFADSYGADWDSINYMGRAEKFYKYKGFNRDISLSFTVVAQSRQELGAMYDKLNFLASSLAPEYLDSANAGYMAGNIAYITLGDYIVDQPGIITGFTFDVPEEASWELARDEFGNAFTIDEKENGEVRQLPMMIKVTGFKFIPIHKFRVEKARWINDGMGKGESDKLEGDIYQKYIDPISKKFTQKFPQPNPPITYGEGNLIN